ncbi:MAG TPA: three-Cys-motif partner protein TcmP [Accumulibacter sp.]|nr:three-Cys-motif partner protein TcmP [Accumulibacter sp.]
MGHTGKIPDSKLPLLFDNLPEIKRHEPKFGPIRHPVWTENKAKLIAKYLQYFVFITKHGIYIDGFAGPKEAGKPGTWAAELVVESEPKRIREFFLCDADAAKVAALSELAARQPAKPRRNIRVYDGDFNEKIDEILGSGLIKEKKATFCLLDQFAMECHWETVRKIAMHKKVNKIEIFYFLCTGWLERTLSGFTRNVDIPQKWWGRQDWKSLALMSGQARASEFVERFKSELGYKYATPWPILNRGSAGKVMFHMIHATDHDEASALMYRAYRKATNAPDPQDQFVMDFAPLAGLRAAYPP